MTTKIVVTKPGYDSVTEPNDKNKIFDSDLNHLKTHSYGSFQQVGDGTTEITHNLGYRPLVVAYFQDIVDTTKWYITLSSYSATPARQSAPANVSLSVDSSKVYFKTLGNESTLNVQYEIFYEGDA